MNNLYALVENNKIVKLMNRPNWLNDSGKKLTNEELKTHGILPIKDNPPKIDGINFLKKLLEKNDMSEWIITDSDVTVTYKQKPIDFNITKEALRNNIKSARKRFELNGILFTDSENNNLEISTSPESQNKIFNLKSQVTEENKSKKILFKTKDGFKEILNSDIVLMANSIMDFIQECFNREFYLLNKIEGCNSHEELFLFNKELIEGWPKNSLEYNKNLGKNKNTI